METKFQTSFIPKKPLVPASSVVPSSSSSSSYPSESGMGSIFFTIGIFIFILSLVAAGGSYVWTNYLLKQQNNYDKILKSHKEQFDLDLIRTLKQVNVKIDMAEKLIKNHVAASQIFEIVSRMTISGTRFLSMELSTVGKDSNRDNSPTISLSGYSSNFSSLAFQSDILGRLEQYGLRNIVINPVISNPAQNQDRSVSFNLTATINPESISYTRSVSESGTR